MKKLHYENSGDNYKIKDPFKILALNAAKSTAKNLKRLQDDGLTIKEINRSRGESAYRFEITTQKAVNFQIAHVEEGIGTKNVIADELASDYGAEIYASVAIDNAASIFNDLSTTGASAVSFMLHLAAYPTSWFSEESKIKALIRGTVEACNQAGASWGGGESPTMRDIIKPGKALLSGSALGLIYPSSLALSEEKIESGDRIILLESSGVHTNGITLLRKELLKRLPYGYKTKLKDGSTYGQALLTPTLIYSRVVEKLLKKAKIHYAVHITGHGFRKLMRANRSLSYILENIPKPPLIFDFIQKYSAASDRDMYDSYNMGAGFALFAPANQVDTILKICSQNRLKAWDAGTVNHGPRRLEIKPLGIQFENKDLILRET